MDYSTMLSITAMGRNFFFLNLLPETDITEKKFYDGYIFEASDH